MDATQVRIRAAVVQDARAIGEVFAAAFRAGFSGLLSPEALSEIAVAERRAAFQAQSASGAPSAYRTFVAEDASAPDPRIVGFVDTRPRVDPACPDGPGDPVVGEVHALYLLPQYWGRGIGRDLMRRALDDLSARGFTAVTLWVLDRNARSQRFYTAAGFADDGARKRVEVAGEVLPHLQYAMPLSSR